MIDIAYAELFHQFPPEFATVLIAMVPIAELRVALPLALTTFNLPIVSALFWSIVGNMIPVVILVFLLEPINRWLARHSKAWQKFFAWISDRTEKKFSKNSIRYGMFFALMVFVAIPLPMTGAWSGALAAFLFRIPARRSITAIFLGVLIAAFIVLSITQGITSIV